MNRSRRLAAVLAAMSATAPVAGYTQAPATQPHAAEPPVTRPQAPGTPAAPAPAAQAPVTVNQPPRPRIYYHAGGWDAFSGRGITGGPVCGVGTNNPATGRALSIRFDIGGTDTIFDSSKPDWAIPDGMQVQVVMQIGLNPPWTLRGAGHGQVIEWPLDRNAIQTFDQQFRSGDSMTLTYPNGNEPPWRISLAGSTAISDTFGRCVIDLTRQMQSGQPPPVGSQGAQAATQPFSQSPAGTPSGAVPAR